MQKSERFQEIVSDANLIFKEYPLCERCLGRLFAKKLNVTSNKLLGKKILKKLGKKPPTKCYICKSLVSNLQFYLDKLLDQSSGYRFSSFVIGATLKHSLIDRDDQLRSKFKLRGIDSIKTDITREISKKFAQKTKKHVDHLSPDLTVTINFKDDSIELHSKPIFLFGYYNKTKRGLSQKQKSCDSCFGKGCIQCNYHGISEFNSIEGKISQYLFDKFGASQLKIAWIGGEDKNSLVLGKGRPFFVKLINPHKRRKLLTKKIPLEHVTLTGLKFVQQLPKTPLQFKSVVELFVEASNELHSSDLSNLKKLRKSTVQVLEKSGKKIKNLCLKKYKKISSTMLSMKIEIEGGFPINRFVEGPNVSPNLSKLLGNKCKCKQFDFHKIVLQ